MVDLYIQHSSSCACDRWTALQVLQKIPILAFEATKLDGSCTGISGIVGGVVEAVLAVGEEVATVLADSCYRIFVIVLHALTSNTIEESPMIIVLITYDAIMA